MTAFKHFKKTAVTAFAAAALSLGLSLPASATLIGDTITITTTANVFPVDTWTDNVVVGAGAELVGIDNPLIFNPFPVDNFSLLQHENAFLSGAQFQHLFSGDSYDIGANSITIVFGALAGLGFGDARAPGHRPDRCRFSERSREAVDPSSR